MLWNFQRQNTRAFLFSTNYEFLTIFTTLVNHLSDFFWPCYSTEDVWQYPETVFGGRVIGRYSEVSWPARSSDLTLMDYFFMRIIDNSTWNNLQFAILFNRTDFVCKQKTYIHWFTLSLQFWLNLPIEYCIFEKENRFNSYR